MSGTTTAIPLGEISTLTVLFFYFFLDVDRVLSSPSRVQQFLLVRLSRNFASKHSEYYEVSPCQGTNLTLGKCGAGIVSYGVRTSLIKIYVPRTEGHSVFQSSQELGSLLLIRATPICICRGSPTRQLRAHSLGVKKIPGEQFYLKTKFLRAEIYVSVSPHLFSDRIGFLRNISPPLKRNELHS
jgi:hypothetical protein